MDFLILIIGFVLLIKGADMLVDGASSIAKNLGISPLVIGLTIVAFGTSAPELVVNLMSAFSGETDLAISNIIGSNISNIFLILGLTALIFPISMPKTTVKNEIPFLIFASSILLLLLSDGILTRIDSIALLMLFVGFLFYTYKLAKNSKNNEINNGIKSMSYLKSSIFIILGLFGLIYGGNLIVNSAVSIATNFGLPKSFIGITIVAIGTSLPELAASLMAAFKKNTDMAIGGIVGSNIFNILWILGLTGFIHPLKGYIGMILDLKIELIASMFIFLAAFILGKNFISKIEGLILFLFYIGYISFLTINVII